MVVVVKGAVECMGLGMGLGAGAPDRGHAEQDH
jgi:hypothetical protein